MPQTSETVRELGEQLIGAKVNKTPIGPARIVDYKDHLYGMTLIVGVGPSGTGPYAEVVRDIPWAKRRVRTLI